MSRNESPQSYERPTAGLLAKAMMLLALLTPQSGYDLSQEEKDQLEFASGVLLEENPQELMENSEKNAILLKIEALLNEYESETITRKEVSEQFITLCDEMGKIIDQESLQNGSQATDADIQRLNNAGFTFITESRIRDRVARLLELPEVQENDNAL